MNLPLRVLHLEDDPGDAELVRYHLEAQAQAAAEPAPAISVVDTRAGFEAALAATGWDLILADYRLPSYDGLAALRTARAQQPDTPFIFVTGELGEERAIETLQQGATDYVLKTRLGRLGPSVARARRAALDRAAAAAEHEWLRVTLGSIGDAVIAADTAGQVTFLNRVAEDLTGWTQAEAMGQPLTAVIHLVEEDTGALVESPVERVLRANAVVPLAHPTLLIPRTGAPIPIDDSGAPIRNAAGALLGVVLVFRDIRERRAAELAVSRSEERYRSLVEAHSAIVWAADPRGQFITTQASWAAYTGQGWPQHQAFGWVEMIHPADRDELLAGWEQAVATRAPFQGQARVWHAPGTEWCHSEVRAIPLLNADGTVREWVGTITDVHARKTAEAAARESEGRFRILANHAPVLVWMADEDGRADFFNDQWLAFTGRPLEAEQGEGWLDQVHPDDLERVLRLRRAAVTQRQGSEMEYRLRRHDGEYRWVVDIGVPRFDPHGDLAGFIGSAIDIHARKAAEAARRESEGRFRILADSAPVLMWMANTQGLADFFNQPWLAFTGRPLEAELGDGWATGIHPADFERTLSAYRAAFAARRPVELEFQLRRHDGEYRWVVSHAVPRYEPDGRFAGYIASGIDIHERKAATQALRTTRDQIAAILRGVAEGVTVHDDAGQLVYANDMAAHMLGYATAAELLAAPPREALTRFEIFDEQGRPFPLSALPGRRALQGEAEPEALVRFRAVAEAEEHWSEIRARPIFDADGRAVLAVNIFHDITAIKRTEQTQRLLAEAGRLLSGALDEAHLARGLLELLVPGLADMGVAYLLEPGGAGVRATYTHATAEQSARLAHIAPLFARGPASLLNEILASDEARLATDFAATLAARLPADTAALLAEIEPHSALLTPLRAQGQTLGVLVLGRRQGPRYTSADLALASELGSRAALALENARLYAAAQQQAAWLEARVHERTETLRQSERRLAEAQQIASLGSWHWDIDHNTLTWSEAMYHVYGVDPAAFTATYEGFLALVHPDDRSLVEHTVGTALAERRGYTMQHRIVRPDGQVRTLAARGEITLDGTGRPVALTGIGRDVTDQLAIEHELRESREQLRLLSGHLQAARETERARISREIHDELGGALTGLKMDVARLAKNVDTLTPDGVRAQTQSLLALLDEAVKTVRRIATDLRPALLDDFGLAAAMEWQLQEFQKRSGLVCTFTTNADDHSPPLPPEAVTALFRVFQEALTNVARHAQATTVSARLELFDTHLELEVQDNGRGITPGEITGRRSLGLLGMRERVSLLAGELHLRGAPGQGTGVTVRLPLERRD